MELGFVERDLLAAVPLLFDKLDGLLSRSLTTCCTLGSHAGDATERTLLHQRRTNSSCHRHLLGHGWIRLKLLMDSFDDRSKRGVLRIPALDSWPSVLNGHWVERRVRHRGHHVDLGWHLRELIRQSDFDVEGRWRDGQL